MADAIDAFLDAPGGASPPPQGDSIDAFLDAPLDVAQPAEQDPSILGSVAGRLGDVGRFGADIVTDVIAGTVSTPRFLGDLAASGLEALEENVFQGLMGLPPAEVGQTTVPAPTFDEAREAITIPGVNTFETDNPSLQRLSTLGEFVTSVNPLRGAASLGQAVRNIPGAVRSQAPENLLLGGAFIGGDVAASGLSGEGATEAERAAAGLLGLGLGAGALGAGSTIARRTDLIGPTAGPQARAETILSDATSALSDQQLQQGVDLANLAKDLGIKLTGNEVFDTQALQGVVSGVQVSPGGQGLEEFLRERQPAIEGLIEEFSMSISPKRPDVANTAQDLVRESTAGFRDIERARTQFFNDYIGDAFTANVDTNIPRDIHAAITEEMVKHSQNSKTFKQLRSARALLVNNRGDFQVRLDVLDNVVKEFEDSINTPSLNANALSKESNALFTKFKNQLRGRLKESNPQYRDALEAFEDFSTEAVTPRTNNPILETFREDSPIRVDRGVADFGDFVAQIDDTKKTSPRQVKEAGLDISSRNPQLWRDATRAYFDSVLGKVDVTPIAAGGRNPEIGAKFVNALKFRDRNKRDNILGMLQGIDSGYGLALGTTRKAYNNYLDAVEDMMKVLERTGVTPGLGSATGPRGAFKEAAGDAPAGRIVGSSIERPIEAITRVFGIDQAGINQRFGAAVTANLVRILTDENAADIIADLARNKPTQQTLRNLLLFGTRAGVQGVRESQQGAPPTPESPEQLDQDSSLTAPTQDKFAGNVDIDRAFQALIGTESNGQQLDGRGRPLRSHAGAIGIAQVMPGTLPEAAKLAGLPVDRERYKFDADYNAAIGRAYFEKQLSDFGRLDHAFAAYNAGPGRMRKALRKGGENWINKLPQETQNYVRVNMAKYRGLA